MRVFGYEITAKTKLNEEDEEVEATSWTTKMPKAAQPNLNYIGARTIKL